MHIVTKPTIGADFLIYYGLLIDIQNKRIIHNTTNLFKKCISIESPIIEITLRQCFPYANVLNDFSSLTTPFSKISSTEYDVRHYIDNRISDDHKA